MLRTAERYFDAALAAEALRVLQRQQQAVERSLAEARDRFTLGDAPVTDTHEAAARAQAVRADVLAAESALALKRAALADLTGWSGAELRSLALAPAEVPQPVPSLDQWLSDARSGNLQLRTLAVQVEVAQQEAVKYGAAAAPTVDVVAQVGQDRLSGSGDFGSASNQMNNALIGVQLNVPLYSGGWRSARQDRAGAWPTRRAEADHQALQVAQQTRAAWLKRWARRACRLASMAGHALAPDATRIGRQVGDARRRSC